MKIAQLEELYDFAESEVVEVYWKRQFRDLVLKMDGIWYRGHPRPDHYAAVKLTLRKCLWAEFSQKRAFCESERRWARRTLTIIGWSRKGGPALSSTLQDALTGGYEFVEFTTEITVSESWLQVVCLDCDIIIGHRKSDADVVHRAGV